MPQSKKKTAVKTGKSGSGSVKKKPVAKPGGSPAGTSVARKQSSALKPGNAKKVSAKQATAKLQTKTASKKVTKQNAASKPVKSKAVAAKKSTVKASSASRNPDAQASASKSGKVKSGKSTSSSKVDRKARKPSGEAVESNAVPAPEITVTEPQPKAAGAESKSRTNPAAREPARKRGQDSELAGSIQQGLAKHGQKKRGWRDIEALTERARLKNLLSDIWHEDIDLDSDIFGETDQFSSYYTDKEEDIEVEDDEDEEWEEFEEDES